MIVGIIILIASFATKNSKIYLLFGVPAIELGFGCLLFFLFTLINHF
jgi:hypothetical protein